MKKNLLSAVCRLSSVVWFLLLLLSVVCRPSSALADAGYGRGPESDPIATPILSTATTDVAVLKGSTNALNTRVTATEGATNALNAKLIVGKTFTQDFLKGNGTTGTLNVVSGVITNIP